MLLLLISGCATNPPNVPVCIELGMSRGYCVTTIKGEEFYIDEVNKYNGKTFWEMRPEMIMLPPDSWADIKKFIIKICKKTNECQKEVSSWDRSIKNIDEKLKEKTEK